MRDYQNLAKILGCVFMALPFLFFAGFCLATFVAFLVKQPLALVLNALIFVSGLLIYRQPQKHAGE